MDWEQALDRFDFHDEASLNHEIETVAVLEHQALVSDRQGALALEIEPPQG